MDQVLTRCELLAPAGNYHGLLGAISAGADAVYLGGEKFGARAYADNFTQEDIIKGIRYAHLHNVKIYLTVNTLIKEREFNQLYDYIMPFYNAGLDGIIVQDMGVLAYVRKVFPELEIHISTQMNITGVYGAAFLKEEGAVRIVPARELSLEEIKEIKRKTDIEIETFVHGALCYSYSGQCLFSSILGGRSGNRGRCAQPCRLPYHYINNEYATKDKKQEYDLSMKDLCAIELIPELIEAGIDSFKIEGRMKNPEYTAGVTAIYRKYIDLYYKNGKKDFKIAAKDMQYLRLLYIRSSISQGYYHKHNGKDMITLKQPGYNGSEEALLEEIRDKYIKNVKKLSITGKIELMLGQPMRLQLKTHTGIAVSMQGEIVEPALQRPIMSENVRKQMNKMGNTSFILEDIQIIMDKNIFVQMKDLNDIRRKAVTSLEDAVMKHNGFKIRNTALENDIKVSTSIRLLENISKQNQCGFLHVSLQSREQWDIVKHEDIKRIYIDADLLMELDISKDLIPGREYYMSLPYIVRQKDAIFLEKCRDILLMEQLKGVLVRNYESYAWLKTFAYDKEIVADSGIYIWNQSSFDFWAERVDEWYSPWECTKYELQDIASGDKRILPSIIVYGRIPMMISANCLNKTTVGCKYGKDNETVLVDRYEKKFPVYTNCKHCYNVIYNSVPVSMHTIFKDKDKKQFHNYRIDFTVEKGSQVQQIVQYFQMLHKDDYTDEQFLDYEYTTAHYKRGVE